MLFVDLCNESSPMHCVSAYCGCTWPPAEVEYYWHHALALELCRTSVLLIKGILLDLNLPEEQLTLLLN